MDSNDRLNLIPFTLPYKVTDLRPVTTSLDMHLAHEFDGELIESDTIRHVCVNGINIQ